MTGVRACAVLLLIAGLLSAGCVGIQSDRLPDETVFREIHSAADITGVYINLGQSTDANWQPLLSDFLFTDTAESDPPDEIRLENPSPSILRCIALYGGEVRATRELVEGQDFEIAEGGLLLDRTVLEGVVGVEGVGVGSGSTVLRITEAGDIALTSRSSGAGLMLFIMPMAVHKVQEALFIRIE